jgi:hypothetical protein
MQQGHSEWTSSRDILHGFGCMQILIRFAESFDEIAETKQKFTSGRNRNILFPGNHTQQWKKKG